MGSPFVSLSKSDPIPLPFDPPNTIVVRKLTGREVEQVQMAHARGVAIGRSRLWSENFKRILTDGMAKAGDLAAALADPLTGFDRFAVVSAGLVAWSYPQPTKPVPATADAPAYDPIDDLDDEAVEFIAREVMRLTRPALFLTVEQQETERKND